MVSTVHRTAGTQLNILNKANENLCILLLSRFTFYSDVKKS